MNPRTHVQSQTHFVEFDLSLTKIQCPTIKNARGHVTGQTHFVEFDMSLTAINNI